MDCGTAFQRWLPGAVADGGVTRAALASAAAANLGVRFRTGVFDPPAGQPMAAWGNESVCTPSALALSLRAAEEGMVLLKNAPTGGLPLSRPAASSLALVGGNGNDTLMQLCSYYSTPCEGFDGIVTPLAALPAFTSSVRYAEGCDAGCASTVGFPAAEVAAAAADATVLAVGLYCKLTGEGTDRGAITLPGHTDELVARTCAAAAPRPCIVVLFTGSSLDVSAPLTNPNVTAILLAGYGGPQGGTALARVLFGAAAPPAGRLTATWYRAAYTSEVGVMAMGMRPGPSAFPPGTSPGHTHRFYAGNATLFPFGFGLSYTTWAYTEPEGPAWVSVAAAGSFAALGGEGRALGALAAPLTSPALAAYSVNVTNTGALDSDDVVLAFLEPPGGGQGGVPLQELVGFQRVHVRAGETVTVWIGLAARDLTGVDGRGRRVARPGLYTLRVGVVGRWGGARGGGGAPTFSGTESMPGLTTAVSGRAVLVS